MRGLLPFHHFRGLRPALTHMTRAFGGHKTLIKKHMGTFFTTVLITKTITMRVFFDSLPRPWAALPCSRPTKPNTSRMTSRCSTLAAGWSV
jgi:hypothetical protein